jgi:metal-dependent amidase/aminoacylase/carboxypeptidase family protein
MPPRWPGGVGAGDTDTPPLMGAEDFSFMLNERPGAYIFMGNGDTAMVHHPAYNFDDNAIPFGSAGMRAWSRRGCLRPDGGGGPPPAPP